MRSQIVGLGVILAVLTVGATSAQATLMVDWGGSADYVAATQAIVVPGIAFNTSGSSRTAYYVFTGTAGTSSEPASGYTPPSGKSGVFYSGSYITALTSTANRGWSQREVANVGVTNDYINYRRGGSADTAYEIMAFDAYYKEDFLNGGAAQTVSLESGSAITLDIQIALSAVQFQLAVLQGSQWYVSETAYTTTGAKALSGASLQNENWGLWNPNGGANSRLGALPVTFGSATSGFTDIDAFGVVMYGTTPANNSIGVAYSQFSVDVVPEPGVLSLGLFGIGALFLMRIRRSVR